MIWFTSDHHFGHFNIIRLTGRPFTDLEDMHRVLKARWNERIGPQDLVYIVGDLSFMQATSTRKLCHDLNGRKILIQGNHDKEKTLPRDCFEEIVTKKKIHIGTHSVLLCHYPYLGTKEEIEHAKANGYKVRYEERRPENKGDWLVHGHVHEKWKVKRNMINVSVEPWDYYPVSEAQLQEIMDNGVETDIVEFDNSNVYVPQGGDNL